MMNHKLLSSLMLLLLFLLFTHAYAEVNSKLSVSTTSVSIKINETVTVTVNNASGTVSVKSNELSIAKASYANGRVSITGLKAGSTTVEIKDKLRTQTISVTVQPASLLSVSPTSIGMNAGGSATINVSNSSGTVTVNSNNTGVATVSYSNGIATVKGLAAGSATITVNDAKNLPKTVIVTVSGGISSSAYTLLAWNDLGMHCMDGLDYSVYSILPPYNTLHAQLKDKKGGLISSGVTLTYEAVADSTKSINTYSASQTPIKTNFWDEIGPMLGLPANTPPKDVGLNLDGMFNGTPAPGNPVPSLKPAPMTYNPTYAWWEAEGIPITPLDDKLKTNYYPTVKVVAKDLAGKVLATTTNVLPVSDEMTCKACHASTTSTNKAAIAAKPTTGWVNDSDPNKDWKKNILKLHDQKELSKQLFTKALASKGYDPAGLLASAEKGKPVFCALCHASNAYTDKSVGKTVMGGLPGIPAFTAAMHTKHALVIDPASNKTLDAIDNRTSCYQCHPGSVTQCLRGAMSTAVDTNGKQLSCQNCHGNMSTVGNSVRKGWLEEPNCQTCHNSAVVNKRGFTATLDPNGKVIEPLDRTFATNNNTPLPETNLYRFSKGHGGLQCEACHGPTHAEYPSTHSDDNAQSVAIQGHVGTVAECTACHTSVPTTVNGGPHGMHTTGNAWVSAHQEANKNGTATTPSCTYCHGTTKAGTPLSAIKVAKTINAGEYGIKNWPAGYQVSCFSCHNGPNP